LKLLRYFTLAMWVLVALLSPMWSHSLHDGALAQDQPECTVVVQPGESIRAAIDGTEEGAVICLAEGTWEENIKIEKSLTLRGVGPEQTVIDGIQEGFPVVWITTSEEAQTVSVRIEDLRITGGEGECADRDKSICPSGLLIQGMARVKVTDCAVSATARHGIKVTSAQTVITDATISGNRNDGLVLVSGQATVSGSTISDNHLHGIRLWGSAQIEITNSTIHGNMRDGVRLASSSQATIVETKIAANRDYGVALFQRPCSSTDWIFSGHLAGRANTIPGPEEPEGNGKGAVCPEELDFLMTAEGGEYPLGLPTKGSPDAPVTMVEFSDFMCPYCARFATETLPKIEEEYVETGKVMVVFRHFPVHGEPSIQVAEATLCAHEQHRFWEYHDRLFADSLTQGSRVFSLENLKALAAELGLDTERFNRCVDCRRYSEAVQEDIAEGNRLGVRGTPTFFINGREILGAQPYETFQRAIEEELAKEG